ncbi:MAG: TadE/TadG family type IV pilus assembly protein, partial [Telluria sp.]
VAAVEMAIMLPILIMLLAVPLYYGRVFWHYTVAQKAAHDAARYLISAPLTQMRNPAQVGNALAVANAIIDAELAELNPGPYQPVVTIQCNGVTCGGLIPPSTIRINIQIAMYDPLLSSMTERYVGAYGVLINADATMRYAGN